MWKKEVKGNVTLFLKAGLPFTVAGMAIVFSGIYIIKQVFGTNEYLTAILFAWLAVFWIIYQPLFRNRVAKIKSDLKSNGSR